MTASARPVVHVVRSDSFAGVERYVCDVSGELARRGWWVVVVGGDPRAMRRELPPSVEHVPAATTWWVVRNLLSLGPCALVHAHMTAAEVAAVLTRPRTRGRVVATRHFAAARGQQPLVRAAASLLARGLAREIAISRFVADAVGGDPVVLLNGVVSRDDLPLADARTVLVMQRLEPEKDTATAVRAFALSGLARRGWRLQVAGRGSDGPRLKELARSLRLGSSVEWLGFVSDPELARRRACIFLATAMAEPFGLSMAEAMASGLPVVAADGGAHRESLADTGLLYPPGDAVACSELLRQLAGSADQRSQLGRAGRSRQRAFLSLGAHVDGLERLYLELAPTARASKGQ